VSDLRPIEAPTPDEIEDARKRVADKVAEIRAEDERKKALREAA